MDDTSIIRDHYDANPQQEWNRLDGFSFEFEITKRFLKRHMRGKTVLDIGGGAGRYAIHLASLGYDVTMVDLSAQNVRFALDKAEEHGVTIKAYHGDARDVSALSLGTFDNVLLMGPLYHIQDQVDRQRAVREAKRHMTTDGVLFASFISLSGGINYYLSECPLELVNETEIDYFDCMAEDRSWYGPAFTMSYFVDNDEIEPFFTNLGFDKITMFGQEGITATRQLDLEQAPDDVRELYLDVSMRVCEKPKYFAYSSHIMYIGRKSPDENE